MTRSVRWRFSQPPADARSPWCTAFAEGIAGKVALYGLRIEAQRHRCQTSSRATVGGAESGSLSARPLFQHGLAIERV